MMSCVSNEFKLSKLEYFFQFHLNVKKFRKMLISSSEHRVYNIWCKFTVHIYC